MRDLRFLAVLLLLGCADTHLACSDAGSADARAPCGPDQTDEGDACVSWRAIPTPPCTVIGLERIDGAIAARCDDGFDYALGPAFTWEPASGPATPITPESDAPSETPSPRLVVTLGAGMRVVTHGDPYAAPAAWRTHADGAWHETIPPPSAFLGVGAAVSADEALFLGRDAFVYTVSRR